MYNKMTKDELIEQNKKLRDANNNMSRQLQNIEAISNNYMDEIQDKPFILKDTMVLYLQHLKETAEGNLFTPAKEKVGMDDKRKSEQVLHKMRDNTKR